MDRYFPLGFFHIEWEKPDFSDSKTLSILPVFSITSFLLTVAIGDLT